MALENWYLLFSILSLLCTFMAIVKAQRIGALVMVYFVFGWLTGELALSNIFLQFVFSAVFIANGVLDSSTGQWAPGLFILSWCGLLYAQLQSAKAPRVFTRALHRALGDEFKQSIPKHRQDALRQETPFAEWIRPFSMKRPGVKVIRNLAYGD